ncbi:ankyrin repeat-containing domain protein [Baffinella frigidus]|nr:ankyrin repeat-containing domain protein [Cryptophyta sp. CCMP2293]
MSTGAARDGFTAPLPTDHNLGKEGFSALHIACVNGHEKVVGVLLAGGADVMMQANHVRAVGRTLPLHEAAKQGTCEVVAMLLEAGEKVGVNVRNMLGRQNVEGDTALHLASRAGRAQLVEFLCTLNAPRSVLNNQGKRPEEEYDDTAHGHVTVTSAWESTARAISPPIDDDVFNLTPLGWAEQPPSAAAGVGGPAGGQQPTQSFGEGLHIPGVLREHEAPHPPKPRPRDPLEPPPPVRYLRRSSSSTEPSVPSSFRFSSPQRGASVRAVDALPAWGGGHFVPSGERVQQAGVLGGGAMHDTWGGLLEHPVSTLGGGVEEGVGEAQP